MNYEVAGIHHLYAPIILRHQAGNLLKSLLILLDAELWQNQHLFRLEPVDIGPTMFVGVPVGVECQFFHPFEAGLKGIAEAFRHPAVEICIVRQQDPVSTNIPADSVRVTEFFVCIPRQDDKPCTKRALDIMDEPRQIITRILLKNLARHYRTPVIFDHIAAINLDRREHIAASISQLSANLVSVSYRGPILCKMQSTSQ